MDDLRWEYHSAVHGPWHDLRGHLPYLWKCTDRPGAVIAEMGVRTGMSTRALMLAAIDNQGQLWSVDTAPPLVPDSIRGHPDWHFLQADDLSSEAQAWVPAQLDVLFLDAHDDNWTYAQLQEHVLAELMAYGPRVRPGGVILAHDTQWQPPATDLGEPDGAVAAALTTWCDHVGLTWENRPGFYGLGVVRIPVL